MLTSVLWTADQMAARAASSEPPWDWLQPTYQAFTSALAEEQKFPSIFGVSARSREYDSFTVVDSRMPCAYGVEAMAASLREFRERAGQGRGRQSLIAFVGPPDDDPDLARDGMRFWRLLRDLTAHDGAAWPDGFPREVADPKWEWCFSGEPWLTFMCSPAYVTRQSRNVAPCLTVIFQDYKWRQYVMPDDLAVVPVDSCPFGGVYA